MTQVDISALAARVATLEAAAQRVNAPAQILTNGMQVVDATHNARMRISIPTVLLVTKALLSFSLQPFRSATQTAQAMTSSGGGGTHNHQLASQSNFHVQPLAYSHSHAGVDMQFRNSGGGAVTLPVAEQDGYATNTGDLYTWDTSVTHTHSIPTPTLNNPSSLYETGMAQGSHVYVDNVDRTSALGGPWGLGSTLDIPDLDVTLWLTANGWHEIQITSTALGSIIPQLTLFATTGAH